MFNIEGSICLLYGCSKCCSPVKIDCRRAALMRIEATPFIDRGEILAPEEHIDSIRLRSYECINFDQETGLCRDYLNRPNVCRNTVCEAFYADTETKIAEMIAKIKDEKFITIKPFKTKNYKEVARA